MQKKVGGQKVSGLYSSQKEVPHEHTIYDIIVIIPSGNKDHTGSSPAARIASSGLYISSGGISPLSRILCLT